MADVTIQPDRPHPVTQPTVAVRLTNPWTDAVTHSIAIDAVCERRQRTVTLAPGETTRLSVTLPRTALGFHDVRVRANDTTIPRTTFTTGGDDRAVAALGTAGYYREGSGL